MTDRIDTAEEREKLAALEGHTPGPWDNSTPCLVGAMIDDRYEWSSIAIIGNVDRHHKSEKTANARLIVAAPDLKATLSAALDALAARDAEIERLTAENERLREALDDMLFEYGSDHDSECRRKDTLILEMISRAKAALNPEASDA